MNKTYSYVKGVNAALSMPTVVCEVSSNRFVYTTKLVGATTGTCGIRKRASDALEALACQDRVCFLISCISVSADSLTVADSYVSDANFASLVTMPISVGCKSFVWACKKINFRGEIANSY